VQAGPARLTPNSRANEGFQPTDEVTALAWLPASEAIALLDSARDRRAVQRAVGESDRGPDW
jgi:hypothetical protein